MKPMNREVKKVVCNWAKQNKGKCYTLLEGICQAFRFGNVTDWIKMEQISKELAVVAYCSYINSEEAEYIFLIDPTFF